MSALGQKRTFCTAAEALLFDHFVGGGGQLGWNVEAECRGSIEVDYKVKLGRQHDRYVRGVLTFENPAGIDADLAMRISNVWSVAHQTANFGRFAKGIDCRHFVVSRQRGYLNATVVGQQAAAHHERIDGLLRKVCEG